MIGRDKLKFFKKGDSDWQNVLNYWKHCHRVGLTIHALAAICNRDPATILKEMRAEKHTYTQLCYDIYAPIFSWYRYQESIYNYYTGTSTIAPMKVCKHSNINKSWELAQILLERWPWPKYKGIRNWRGLVHVGDKIPKELLIRLQKAAKGEIIA